MLMIMLLLSYALFFQDPGNINNSGDSLYDLGDKAYFKGEYDVAKNQYLAAYQLYQIEKDGVGQSKSLSDAGLSYQHLGQLDSALYFFNEALRLDIQRKDTVKVASKYINIGNVNKYLGRYILALEDFLLAVSLAKKIDAYKIQARALNGIGNLYLDQNTPEKAISFYQDSYKIHLINNGSFFSKSIVLGNLGSAYFQLGNLDSAYNFYHRALKMKERTNRKLSLAYTLEELGRFHLAAENLDSANYYLAESLEIRTAQSDQQGIASVSLLQARFLLETRQYNKVIKKLNDALTYARQYDDRELLLDCYETLVDYHQTTKNWRSAYQYRTDWAALRDSLFNEEKLQVQEIISEQQLQEKEQERLLADQQASLSATESRQQRQNARNNLIIASILAVFLLSAGVGLIVINRQRKKVRNLNVELHHRNEKIKALGEQSMHFTKNALSELTGLLNFQSRKLEGVAKELMQGARLRLDTINILYNLLFANKDKEESQVELADLISKILDNTLDALLSDELQPQREFSIEPTKVSSEVALSMGLIANELCINACKYAFNKPNKRLTTRVSSKENGLYFLFEDNGPGLPPEIDWKTSRSFGLQLITLLAEDLKSDLHMENCSPGLKIELTIANH